MILDALDDWNRQHGGGGLFSGFGMMGGIGPDRRLPLVQALLEHGASVDMEDRGRKSTPLRRAVANTGKPGTSGRQNVAVKITAILLDHGADPKHVNRSGKSMLASTRHPEIRAMLEAAISAS